MTGPVLPERAALLLDLDGTLIDIAPTPDSVVVPPGLVPALRRVRQACGDALAIVTGRPIPTVDGLLGDAPYAVFGEHGGAFRFGPHAAIERVDLPTVPDPWLARAERAVAGREGLILERKARGFALHFRLRPEAEGELLTLVRDLLAEDAADAWKLLPAAMAWEIKPKGADKGTAVTALMARAPFAGRVPVFIGDDITDEDGMRVAREMGGLGWRVQDVFGDAAGVRRWLASL